MHPAAPSPLNSTRTNWTRLVPHPVLTGHVSSLAAGSHAVPYHRPLSHLCRYIYCAAPQDKGERRDDKAAGLARHRAVGALLADLHILETVALYKTPRPESRFTNPFPPRRSTKPQEQKRLGCAARAAMRPLLMRGSPHLAGGLAPRACLALIRPPRAGDPLNDSPVARQATRPSGRVQPALRPGGVERAAGCLAQQRDVSIYGTQCLRSDVSALRRYRGKARAALIRP